MARMWIARLLLGLSLAWTCLLPGAHARGPALAPGSPTAEILVADLPPEARETLAAIRRGGPFRYEKDGTVFGNREGLLAQRERGYYTEYTVRTPGARDRGARRIVAGGDPRSSGEYYYTADHYRSFSRIRE